MKNTVDFLRTGSADTYRNPSPALWGDFPVAEIQEKPGLGIYRYDDFTDLPLAPTLTTEIAFGKYKEYAAAGCTISRISAVNSMVSRLSREEVVALAKQLIFSGTPLEAFESWNALITWTPELVAAVKEQHEGKVLSAKNRTLVSEAISALQKLLEAAEPKDDEARIQSLTALAGQLHELELSYLGSLEGRVKL